MRLFAIVTVHKLVSLSKKISFEMFLFMYHVSVSIRAPSSNSLRLEEDTGHGKGISLVGGREVIENSEIQTFTAN